MTSSIFIVNEPLQCYQHWELKTLKYSLSTARDLKAKLNYEMKNASVAADMVRDVRENLKHSINVLKQNMKIALENEDTTCIVSEDGQRIKILNAKLTQTDMNYCSSSVVFLKRLQKKNRPAAKKQEILEPIKKQLLSKHDKKTMESCKKRRRSSSSDSNSGTANFQKGQVWSCKPGCSKPKNDFANKLKSFVISPDIESYPTFEVNDIQNPQKGMKKRRRIIPMADSSDDEAGKEVPTTKVVEETAIQPPLSSQEQLDSADSKIVTEENNDVVANPESPKPSTSKSFLPVIHSQEVKNDASEEQPMPPGTSKQEVQNDLSNEKTLPLETSTIGSSNENGQHFQESDEEIMFETSDDDSD